MIKKNQRYYNWINRLLDMGIIFVSYIAAVVLWLYVVEKNPDNIAAYYAFEQPLPILFMSFVFIVIFQSDGMYDSFRFKTSTAELVQLIKPFLLCVAIFVGVLFLFKVSDFSRGVMVLFAIGAYIMLCIKRLFLRLILRLIREKGYNQKHVLLVGSGHLAEEYIRNIEENPHYGFRCIGYIAESENEILGEHLGCFEDLGGLIEKLNPDEVIVALQQHEIELVNCVILICEEQGIRVNIIPLYNDYVPNCATIDFLGTIKLINIRAISQDISFNRVLKRFLDICFSALALLILSPLMLIVAAGVRLSGSGPVMFRQIRVGKDRKEFVMYKFRSMVPNKEENSAWSNDRDNRVTPIGAFIRKFSIDELPQFFNVLKGDMSIVGPRPEQPYFVNKYKHTIPRYMVKHQVKPGLTGWAQINGYRGNTSIEKRIEHDIWYIENWSLLLDIKIVLKTALGGMINREKNLSRRKETV